MRRANENDSRSVMDFLQTHLDDCVYIYVDVMYYGLKKNSPIKVWIDTLPASIVIMQYCDCFQLCGTLGEDCKADVVKLIRTYNPHMLYGEENLVRQVQSCLGNAARYEFTSGAVYEFLSYRKCPGDGIVPLSTADMRQAAALMCMDKGFCSNYDIEGLARQLSGRLETKMGRNFGIWRDGTLIGHIATFAECRGLAVTSGLIVHPAYRDKPYGTMLESFLVNMLFQEGFKIFTFVNDPRRIRLLKAMRQRLCGRYAKAVLVK